MIKFQHQEFGQNWNSIICFLQCFKNQPSPSPSWPSWPSWPPTELTRPATRLGWPILYLVGRVGSESAELGSELAESAELTELQPELAESVVANTHKNVDSKITCLFFIFKIFLILTIRWPPSPLFASHFCCKMFVSIWHYCCLDSWRLGGASNSEEQSTWLELDCWKPVFCYLDVC